ncbi:hypothetical protein GCM10010520_68260 [Rhizobium viscosum]
MDLAVGVIIGGIVKSLTDNLIMPVVGAIFGGFDFSNYFFPLSSAVHAQTLAAARGEGAVFAVVNRAALQSARTVSMFGRKLNRKASAGCTRQQVRARSSNQVFFVTETW